MGLENSDSRIAPGLIQAANLVPGQQDYSIGSKAVANMRDALKDGFITADEIGERFSQREGLRKQLQTQQLKNAVAQQTADAPLIQPRADLAGAQINAQSQLVPKEAQVASGAADQALWQQNIATSLHSDQAASALTKTKQDLENIRSYSNNDTIQKQLGEYGLTVPFNPSTGEPDWERAKRQAEAIAQSKFEIAQRMAMIKGVSLKDVSHPGQQPGSTVTRPVAFDAVGRVFDPDKQTFRSFQDIKSGNTAAPGAAQPAQPAAPADNSAPLIQSKGAAASTGDVPIQPKGQADFSQGDEGVSYKPPEVPSEMQLRDEVAKDPAYQQWRKSQGAFEKLNATWADIQKKQTDPKANLKADDIELASNFIKLYDPEAVIREFKWDKLQDARDWEDTAKNAKSLLLGKGTLTPQQRQNLVNVAQNTFHAQENAIQSHVKQYSDLEKKYGYQNVLNDDARGVLTRKPASEGSPAGEGASRNSNSSRDYAGKSWSLGGTYVIPGKGRFTVTDFDISGKPILAPAK